MPVKTVNGLARASIKTVDGLAKASVKTIDGLAFGVYAFDSFTASDATDIDGHVTDSGGYTWTNTGGDSGTIGIKSNTCYASDNSNAPRTTATIDVGTPDVTITITIVDLHASAGSAGICFRHQDTDNDWAFVMVGTGVVTVRKSSSGSHTVPYTDTVTYTPGDTLTVTCSGDDIECFHNATSVFAFTDSANNTATRHGVAFVGTNNDAHHLDDFTLTGI